jgi:hypothetical protein
MVQGLLHLHMVWSCAHCECKHMPRSALQARRECHSGRLMMSSQTPASACRFPYTESYADRTPQPHNGIYGLDSKFPRGKYPREAWPWNRKDAHADATAYNWAKPALWNKASKYSAWDASTSQYKLNTSIYQLYATDCSLPL